MIVKITVKMIVSYEAVVVMLSIRCPYSLSRLVQDWKL